MKLFNYFFIIVFVAMISISMNSCSDDDSGDGKSSSNIEQILKANGWKSQRVYNFGEWGDDNLSLSKDQTWLYFLDNNVALGKWYYHEDDTYFGSSTSIKPFESTYSVNGSTVTIDGKSFSYKNDALYASDGKPAFIKDTKDLAWIEKYKYYVMPDKERLNFDYWCGFEKFSAKPVKDGSKWYAYGWVNFGVNGSQKAYSRQVSYLSVECRIEGGKFTSKKNVVSEKLWIYDDVDYSKSVDVAFETTNSTVTIEADIYLHDSKNNNDKFVSTQSYKIDVVNWVLL